VRGGAYIQGSLAALAVALLILPGCGGGGGGSEPSTSVEDVLAEVQGLDGAARTKKLVELAEAGGGELHLYTTMDIDLGAALAEAFEDTYDMDTSVFKGGDTLVQRIVEEKKAGFRGGDVVEVGGQHFQELGEAGAIQPYRSPSVNNLVAGSVHEDWTADRLNVFAVARNTKLVPADEVPRRWEDLADPRWKGKLALDNEIPEWFKSLWEYWVASGKSPAEADRLMDAIGRNAVFLSSGSLLRQLLAAGEFDLGVALRHTVQHEKEEGAPIDWQPSVEPLFWKPDGVAMIAEPPNPAAAALFVDWLLGDGQKVFEEFKTDPLRKDLLVAPTVKQIPIDIEDFLANQDEWQERYDAFVRLGTKGPEG
jgi:iron(III) transport system substrate-binding protein